MGRVRLGLLGWTGREGKALDGGGWVASANGCTGAGQRAHPKGIYRHVWHIMSDALAGEA